MPSKTFACTAESVRSHVLLANRTFMLADLDHRLFAPTRDDYRTPHILQKLLQDVERLFGSSRAGVERVTPWFGGILIGMRGDGNCLFSSSMVACVVDSAMDTGQMSALVEKTSVVRCTEAYRALCKTPKYQVIPRRMESLRLLELPAGMADGLPAVSEILVRNANLAYDACLRSGRKLECATPISYGMCEHACIASSGRW